MEIFWYGQSCFLIKTKYGNIVIDPYDSEKSNTDSKLHLPKIKADVVLATHDHSGHNGIEKIAKDEKTKKPFVISGPGEYEISGINICGLQTSHGENSETGKSLGLNTVYSIQAEDLNLVHLGDLGELLTDEQQDKIGKVDILFAPIGGYYTLSVKQIINLINTVEPKIVIPMHYNLDGDNQKLSGLSEFQKEIGLTQIPKKDSLKISEKDLPSETEIIALECLGK